MLDEVAKCLNPTRAAQLMESLHDMHERDRMLALRSHYQETQDKSQLASTYSDEWVSTKYMGEKVWARMWFTCQRLARPEIWEGAKVGRCVQLTT